MDSKLLGEKIKTARMSHNFTQAVLAEELGVSQSLVNMWESGKRRPDIDMLEALADVFNTTLSYFTDSEDVRASDLLTAKDRDRLEAFHQNPKLGLLFDRQRNLSENDIDIMLSIVERIQKEVEN